MDLGRLDLLYGRFWIRDFCDLDYFDLVDGHFWMYGFVGAWMFWTGDYPCLWRLSLDWLLHLKFQTVYY